MKDYPDVMEDVRDAKTVRILEDDAVTALVLPPILSYGNGDPIELWIHPHFKERVLLQEFVQVRSGSCVSCLALLSVCHFW